MKNSRNLLYVITACNVLHIQHATAILTTTATATATATTTAVLLFKGRGPQHQSVGVAFSPRFDGPFLRSKQLGITSGEDPWGWIDPRSGTYHSFTHDGNGATSAGGHVWSKPVQGFGSGQLGYVIVVAVVVVVVVEVVLTTKILTIASFSS